MEHLRSVNDLTALRERLLADRVPGVPTIVISAGTCGQASGANDLIRVTKRELLTKQLTDKILLRVTGCHGFCEMEPSVLVEPGGIFYPKVDPDSMEHIVDAVARGQVLEDRLYTDPVSGRRTGCQEDMPFFQRQARTILSRNEKVDPIRIYNYVEIGGYSSLADVLQRGQPAWVIDQVKASGLRGRGGAGFPTGLKWELLAKARNGTEKFIVCNGDEGDPGAYMDRSVMEGNPHSIIEGMAIAAFATGATAGVIYVRNEYPLAIKHLLIALRQARELGTLGSDILGSGFSFDINLVRGAGAFVCGEETALIHSIEGRMGEPRQRPPYPIEKGIEGKPTSINNVETLANIPVIIRHGGAEYAKIGVPGNTGTKIFSLVGKIKNTGLVEVPLGIKIRDVVYGIGGGPVGQAPIKAVQTGGPSGGCIPAHMFDLSIDYDSLVSVGSIMGSGGMIVMDEDTCMVDVAKYFMSFLKDESCGKCFTCRKGTQRMYEILDDITKGQATLADIDLLEELAGVVRDTTMCGLGQSAPNPVLSTLRYFRHEYERHIVDKRCDAFVCKELVGAPCQSACPLGTEVWRYVAHIQRGEYEEAYQAIREPNPFPSVCARVCNHPCESRCRAGTSGGEPVAVRALKRFITDRMDPSAYRPARVSLSDSDRARIAVVGAGPAGLTAAHYLSCKGHEVTLFDTESKPGGMLLSAIPAYRLPRPVLEKEIASLLDDNITFKGNCALGRDITIDGLLGDGFKSVFVALGAHQSQRLKIEGEDVEGVYSGMQFLKAFNLEGQELAKGHVGVIGGGNSAIDAARVALRQTGVKSVTVFYRRTRREMPAFAEEIEAALEEGVALETLVSPLAVTATNGRLSQLQFIRNQLGEIDTSGRRRPVPVPGTEFTAPLDTLIVAISEKPGLEGIAAAGMTVTNWGTLEADKRTLSAGRPGVFAGGDVVSGPNTVVDAIASGKAAAEVIDRYVRGETLDRPGALRRPQFYIEPLTPDAEEAASERAKSRTLSPESRISDFAEVEMPLTVEAARREACRCLRCDLEFTMPKDAKTEPSVIGVETQ